MNAIDFTKYSKFPVSSETFEFMQNMMALIAKIASLGGTNYILEGCTENGTTASEGTVVIAGEILPFAGGTKSTYVVISEAKESVQVYDEAYENLYITRKVIFGSGSGQLEWASFKKFTDLLTLAASLSTLSTSFAAHVASHSVAWANVTGKPSTYAPASHTHAWSAITDKAISLAFLGEFDAAGTTVTTLAGSLTVTVARTAKGTYKLFHNIGHTNYIVVGVATNTKTASLRANQEVTGTSCVVYMSDDGTLNDTGTRFMIITF
jgi:hypothetical protein